MIRVILRVMGLALLVLSLWSSNLKRLQILEEAHAQSEKTVLVTLGKWEKKNNQDIVVVEMGDFLTPKQKALINSGFTTYSQLLIVHPDSSYENPGKPYYKVNCTAKYDTWQEWYDLAQLSDTPQTAVIKDFKQYSRLCLSAEISDPKLIQGIKGSGASLKALLFMRQISLEQANNIKEWLVQQQSGMIQGLFSHMLGELTLSEKIELQVQVPPFSDVAKGRVEPPKPAKVEKTDNKG